MLLPVRGLDGHANERLARGVYDPSADRMTGTKPEFEGLHSRGDDHVGQFGACPGDWAVTVCVPGGT